MPEPPTHATLLQRALTWWGEARDRWRGIERIHTLSAGEIERLAQDVGLTPIEFLKLACRPDGTALLIDRRLAMLHLDPDGIRALSPLLLADLQRTCALCPENRRCAEDLATDPWSVGFIDYCPNTHTLADLIQTSAVRRPQE